MQKNARMLGVVREYEIAIKRGGRGRITAASVSGERVLVGLRDEIFNPLIPGKPTQIVCPAGTGYMYHGEQDIHQTFPGGMYEMLRSKIHASRGESADAHDMRWKTQLVFDFVSRFRTWTLLDEEEKNFTDKHLFALARELDHPKRNERKLAASSRFRKAAELRTEKHRKRMPMPAALTAAAGAQQLDRRRADAREILRWIDSERLRVFALVEGVHARLDDAWHVFCPEAFRRPGHPILLVSANPTPQTRKVVQDQLRPIYLGLRGIKVRPLNVPAQTAAARIVVLVKKTERATEPVYVAEDIAAIRASLVNMLIVRKLEMDVISPLSMLLGRWKRLEPHRREIARASVIHECIAFGVWCDNICFDGGMSPKLLAKVMGRLSSATLAAKGTASDLRKQLLCAKKMLKILSASLTL